jgi:hypothetical protein
MVNTRSGICPVHGEVYGSYQQNHKHLIVIREAVQLFSEEMEKKLQDNDHKGGWRTCSQEDLLANLRLQLEFWDESHKSKHLLNIANYAMMIWHKRNRTGNYK